MCPAELPTVAQVRLARPATDGELEGGPERICVYKPNPQPDRSLHTGQDDTLPLCYDFSVGHGLFEQGDAPIPHGNGAVAQLGERFNGIEEVEGSNPSSSTSTFI